MWLSDDILIEVSRSAVVPIGLQLIDETSNEPINITGFSFACKVAKSDGEDVIASPTVTISNAPLGQFDVVFDGSDFASVEGDNEAVTLSYQITVDDGVYSVIAMRGPLKLSPGIM